MATHKIVAEQSLRELSGQMARMRMEIGNLQRRLAAYRCELGDDDVGIFPGKTGGTGITAASSNTLGTGTVTLYTVTSNSSAVESSTETVTCLNIAGEVNADTHVLMARDRARRYWAIVERCT